MNAHESIAWDLAAACSARVCRRVIRHLQQNRDLLSGDDSPLVSAWEEICVQVQYEHSFFWSVYDALARRYIDSEIHELAPYELEALWLQTQEGNAWLCEDEAEQGTPPVVIDDIVDYLAGCLYSRAADWSNGRIRHFLDRGD